MDRITFSELANKNGKSEYNILYDKWMSIYGSFIAKMCHEYACNNSGNHVPEYIIDDVRKEAEFVANLATGVRHE